MNFQPLGIGNSGVFKSEVHNDSRGYFSEWFQISDFNKAMGEPFTVAQSNLSLSRKGVLRGVHGSSAKGGQSKILTCLSGSIFDVLVDLRPSSQTVGQWVGINLEAGDGQTIYIPSGMGRAFMALQDNTVVSYLLSSIYSPDDEFSINPLDQELKIVWPSHHLILSKKDQSAQSFQNYLLESKDLPKDNQNWVER